MKEKLEEILKTIPVLLVNEFQMKRFEGYQVIRGMARRTIKGGEELNYTVLNIECDNLTETLLHESLHHALPYAPEAVIENLTEEYYKEPEYKKLAQNKIVELLEYYEL